MDETKSLDSLTAVDNTIRNKKKNSPHPMQQGRTQNRGRSRNRQLNKKLTLSRGSLIKMLESIFLPTNIPTLAKRPKSYWAKSASAA